MKSVFARLAVAVPFAILAFAPFSATPAESPPVGAPQKAMVTRYCAGCHNSKTVAGGLDLSKVNYDNFGEDAETWEKVVRKLRTGMMPPLGAAKPPAADLQNVIASTEFELDRYAAAHPNPGAPALHRLNRTEYANAVRDLLDINTDVSTLLPADDSAEGFDNIASVLAFSPTLIQGYVSAAMKLSREATGDRGAVSRSATYRPPAGLSQDIHIEGLPLGTRGGMLVTHNFPLDADYDFEIAATTNGLGNFGFGVAANPQAQKTAELNVTLNGRPVVVKNPNRFTMKVKAGPQTIGIALVDRLRAAGVDDIFAVYGTNGAVQSLVITGPKNPTGIGQTPSRNRLFVCTPSRESQEESCARNILAKLATRAYRRPVAENDPALTPVLASYREGRAQGDFNDGIQHGVARVLVDPRFLLRFEAEPAKTAPGAVYRISDIELASRLSFFLWSSIPDDRLIEVAAKGQLSKPAGLAKEVQRMLADPKAEAIVQNFGGQWLMLRDLANVQPDVKDFDANLRASFQKETELLFGSVVQGDQSVVRLLDADYTFVDERLARHYGISGIRGSYMRKISLPADSPRRGLLGQGSILTATSVADRTSPVSRGKWVVENLLGVVVPPPPPTVERNLDVTAAASAPTTLRHRLEQHRSDPTCAACHKIMDPIGFSMESFDLVGRWRDKDGGLPIDSTGQLQDGTKLDGPVSLRAALLTRSDSFVMTFTEKLMTYAIGRPLKAADMPAVRVIERDAAKADNRFSAIVLGIVQSAPFQQRVKAGPHAQLAAAEDKTWSQK